MSRLAYCKKCRATYPLAIVSGDSRQKDRDKDRPLTCPFGHTEVKAVDELDRRGGKK
jgi:hypothetical protein